MKEVIFSKGAKLKSELCKDNAKFYEGVIISQEEGEDFSYHGRSNYEVITTIEELESKEVFIHNSHSDGNSIDYIEKHKFLKNF